MNETRKSSQAEADAVHAGERLPATTYARMARDHLASASTILDNGETTRDSIAQGLHHNTMAVTFAALATATFAEEAAEREQQANVGGKSPRPMSLDDLQERVPGER